MKQVDPKDLREVHSLINSAHGATTRAQSAQETVKSNLERAGELIAGALKQNDAPLGDGIDEAIAGKEKEDVDALIALLRQRYPDAGEDGETWAKIAQGVILFLQARLEIAESLMSHFANMEFVRAQLDSDGGSRQILLIDRTDPRAQIDMKALFEHYTKFLKGADNADG